MKPAAGALKSSRTLRIPVEAKHHLSAVGTLNQRAAAINSQFNGAPH